MKSLFSPLTVAILGTTACGSPPSPPIDAPYVEPREPCAVSSPLRNLYFGDLHVHTSFSFDAHAFDVNVTPEDAYRFARGEALDLPPLDALGKGTRPLRLGRPLDFAAVTDHSEFLGEVEACTVPGTSAYDSATCKTYRMGGPPATAKIGLLLAFGDPKRWPEVCGDDGELCRELSNSVWGRIQRAAQQAYDRSSRCSFTSFIGYEYSAAPDLSTLHRNVIFRNDHVPFPTTTFEQPTAAGLWRELSATCLANANGCDVLAIPHNSNESNGKMFGLEYAEGSSLDEQRQQAKLRAELEPLVEIFQHKGDAECHNGLAGPLGAPDEYCGFEKSRRPVEDCKDSTGTGGTMGQGCQAARDYVRYALLDGLREEARLGVNPLRLGIVASTDTHNGTPGAVDEARFIGHRGADDDTPEKQLGPGFLTPGGVEFTPGGIVGVWAEENSRPSLFDALRRRETIGTSGPRIAVRFFGSFSDWSAPTGGNLCDDPELLRKAYKDGVPMGGQLETATNQRGAPSFVVSALRDPGDATRPGTRLAIAQIIKGRLAKDGTTHYEVFDVAGRRRSNAGVDTSTCTATGTDGHDALCGVWRDPSFDPAESAFYYARVIENPSCRWSTYTCNSLPAANRPAACSDPSVVKAIEERAWTSPIWVRPGL